MCNDKFINDIFPIILHTMTKLNNYSNKHSNKLIIGLEPEVHIFLEIYNVQAAKLYSLSLSLFLFFLFIFFMMPNCTFILLNHTSQRWERENKNKNKFDW